MIKAYAEAYNKIINDSFLRDTNKCKRSKNISRELIRFIIKLCFEKENEIKTEYSFNLIDELVTKFSIKSDDIFIHLGCSYGQVLFQIASMILCKKIIGIESNSSLYRSAKVNSI
jgi:hypothetical protein